MNVVVPAAVHLQIERFACREEGVSLCIPRYFVGYVDQDGSAIGIWDGTIYSEALDAAVERKLPIVDITRASI
jgi:hypothetical protein